MPRNFDGKRKPAGKSSKHLDKVTSESKKIARRTSGKRAAAHKSQNAFKTGADEAGDDDVVEIDDQYTKGLQDGVDSEIDSDEAFNSSDDEKFTSYKFSGSRRKPATKHIAAKTKISRAPIRPREIDLNEDSDVEQQLKLDDDSRSVTEESSLPTDTIDDYSDVSSASDFEGDQGNDLMDLSEMLSVTKKNTDNTLHPVQQTSNLKLGDIEHIPFDEAGTTDSEEQFSPADAPSAGSFSSDDASNGSTSDGDQQSLDESNALEQFVEQLDSSRPRSSINKTTQSGSAFTGIKDTNELKPEHEFNLAIGSGERKLRLEDMLGPTSDHGLKTLSKGTLLNAPLARPLQVKIDRVAAYETVKEQISQWLPAVKQLREASVLKFPLNEAPRTQANNNTLASTFKPSGALENEIEAILKASGIDSEEKITTLENMEMEKLSVEEVQKRRAELATMRDLMFRQERKAKRQNKIKSKAYRKVHRKEREKLQAALNEADSDPIERSRIAEERRARERMELRHKNTGKWAQKMIARAGHGEGSRAAITEQIKKGEDLQRKIRGVNGDQSDSDSDSVTSHTFGDQDLAPLPQKGVFAMKFMRDADQREAEASYDTGAQAEDQAEMQIEASGRQRFTPSSSAAKQASVHGQKSYENSTKTLKTLAAPTSEQGDNLTTFDSNYKLSHDDENPWLSIQGSSQRRQNREGQNTTATVATKFANKLKKARNEKQNIRHAGNLKTSQMDNTKILDMRSLNNDTGSDAEDALLTNGRRPVLNQAELVAKAFAGDDVVAEFEAEKHSVKEQDAPQEIDETLPGWGTWTGDGLKRNKHVKKFTRHVDGINPLKRKDHKLEHVIINEKRMKPAKPYLASSVPFPYETRDQYERSLRMPLGPEWSTRTTFQKSIMPKTVIRQGAVVAPMDRK